jgi:hypothetical protein
VRSPIFESDSRKPCSISTNHYTTRFFRTRQKRAKCTPACVPEVCALFALSVNVNFVGLFSQNFRQNVRTRFHVSGYFRYLSCQSPAFPKSRFFCTLLCFFRFAVASDALGFLLAVSAVLHFAIEKAVCGHFFNWTATGAHTDTTRARLLPDKQQIELAPYKGWYGSSILVARQLKAGFKRQIQRPQTYSWRVGGQILLQCSVPTLMLFLVVHAVTLPRLSLRGPSDRWPHVNRNAPSIHPSSCRHVSAVFLPFH